MGSSSQPDTPVESVPSKCAPPDTPIAHDLIAAWLRLACTPGIGPVNGRQLVTACGGVREIWQQAPAELKRIEGIGEKAVKALSGSSDDCATRLMEQCAEQGIDILCLEDERYPALLRQLDDAPLILFARGSLSALKHPRLLAVVGARKADSEGRLITRRWCASLARQGIGIVSGMAYGIDAAAHGGALDAGDGGAPTIAVLGCGLASPFSPVQQKQIAVISEQGCVISEFQPDEQARPEHFPRRNRIIAGMTAATLVVQADVRSGSLITARLAGNYGREVLAIPGSPLGGRHAGCHQLLRDGATLIESPDDILTCMGWQGGGKKGHVDYTAANDHEAKIMQILDGEIMHIDALAEHCALTVPELSPILLGLELLDVVEALPGSRYTLA
jgi:DNA processing protein